MKCYSCQVGEHACKGPKLLCDCHCQGSLPGQYVVSIFTQAKVNGGEYSGEDLPIHKRIWPKFTWFQRRKQEIIELTREMEV